MDPLSIISVTAAAAQFVDFGVRLITKTADTYHNAAGASSKVAALEAISHDLAALARQVHEKVTLLESGGHVPTASERALLEQCRRCEEVNNEVLDAISSMRLRFTNDPAEQIQAGSEKKTEPRQKEPPPQIWSFMKALRVFWNDARIHDMELRLKNIRSSLMAALVADLWMQCPPATQRGQATRRQVLLNQINQEQDDIIGISSPARVFPDAQHMKESLRVPPDQAIDTTDTACTNAVLQNLEFVSHTDRVQAISEAHHQTYEWIFKRHPSQLGSTDQLQWSSVPEWLEQECDNVYWVAGKPGSGKSTMMKYLVRDPRTVSCLQKWSSARPLLIAAFYSWNAGVGLQKSQEGLLQSLLYQIVEQAPDIAPRLLPERWAMLKIFGKAALEAFPKWKWQELFDAITLLGSLSIRSFNLAIFIDGLDEFISDLAELIQLVRRFHRCPGIKVCVSSRPWNDFRDAFADCPQLRMEALTKIDMELFVHGKLVANRAFKELQATSPTHATELHTTIVEKARGVFLWVSLVTMAILAGLTDGDSLADLQAMLEELPGDLEDLYGSLWSGIKPKYKHGGACILAIFHTFTRSPRSRLIELPDRLAASGIPARILWFADGGASTDPAYITQTLTRRLTSRTRGLLEISPSGQVDCLHRTVNDWLESVWSNLERTIPEDFDANLAVAVGISKDLDEDRKPYATKSRPELWAQVLFCFYFAARVVDSPQNRGPLVEAVDKLKASLSHRWAYKNAGFIAVAAEFGVSLYVLEKTDLDKNLSASAIDGINDNIISSLILGPLKDLEAWRAQWGADGDNLRQFALDREVFDFNAPWRYQLADTLIGAVAKKRKNSPTLTTLLSRLHEGVRHEIYFSDRNPSSLEIVIPANGSRSKVVPYRLAVLEMLEKHGAKVSVMARIRKITSNWVK